MLARISGRRKNPLGIARYSPGEDCGNRRQDGFCRTERSASGCQGSWKRFRRVRPQAAFVMKNRPFVTELFGAAYNAFGQFAEVRRPAGAIGGGALTYARNLQ